VEARERELVVILADISGYTRFMLENQMSAVHGQLCISALIEVLLREVDIPLVLQEIEGDAIFLYAAHPGDEAGWRDVLAQVQTKLPRFFTAFFRAMLPGTEATPCHCAICKNIHDLKLKVIVHVGRAIFHQIAGRPQISGPDVILAHRLLKNSQPNREYLLMTEPAWQELGREMPGFERSEESYEGFGSVPIHVQRLDAAVEREREAFYELPRAEFASRIREYGLGTGLLQFRALAEQLRRPVAPVGWPRRVGFALWLALATPFYVAFILLAQPVRLRARRTAVLRARSRAA
jgi:hypothetical protein